MRLKIYLTLLLTLSFNLVISAQETYQNEKYNFSVKGPQNWHILHHKDTGRDLKESHGVQTLITYFKNPNNTTEQINPTINIYVVQNRFKSIEEFNRKKSKRYYQKSLAAYSVKTKPQLITVGGKYGAFENATYTITNKSNDYLFVRRKTYAFPTKEHIFYVTLVDERDSEQNTQILLDLLETIKIKN